MRLRGTIDQPAERGSATNRSLHGVPQLGRRGGQLINELQTIFNEPVACAVDAGAITNEALVDIESTYAALRTSWGIGTLFHDYTAPDCKAPRP